jgi:hypothetical protein
MARSPMVVTMDLGLRSSKAYAHGNPMVGGAPSALIQNFVRRRDLSFPSGAEDYYEASD